MSDTVPMKRYRIKPGFTWYQGVDHRGRKVSKLFQPGDVVELPADKKPSSAMQELPTPMPPLRPERK